MSPHLSPPALLIASSAPHHKMFIKLVKMRGYIAAAQVL
jgi:hypothetical protein